MTFEPIAIVGRGALLPGADGPDAFWHNIAAGVSSLSRVRRDRWRLPSYPESVPESGNSANGSDRAWTNVGGFVHASPDESGLDPLFSWVTRTGRDALTEAGVDTSRTRAGLVLASLALPTDGMTRYAEQVWSGATHGGDPRDRFGFGLPAHLAAAELGLSAGGFALDAACASSLYAIKLACDQLHDRTADVVLASAVSRADSLILYVGFNALGAMSPTGQSRPFHRDADGLVPAEGAASLALMRLTDAVAEGKEIFAVIRGIGLSNDGSAGGLLAPSSAGQRRAMSDAYRIAGLDPATVTLAECHATGTPVGDATEVSSMASVFADAPNLPVGSAKSNVGHLMTAAGMAAVLKMIGAMRAGVRPATLFADVPLPRFAGTNLRLLHESEPWAGPRRAAISGFGFGGTNAHLILDEWTGDSSAAVTPPVPAPGEPVAVVSLGIKAGSMRSVDEFARVLRDGTRPTTYTSDIEVDMAGLRFPPSDLRQTLGQQLLVMEAARDAVRGLRLPRERTAVLIGVGCDAEAARYPLRWRVENPCGTAVGAEESRAAKNGVSAELTAAGTLGMLPSIAASRIGVQLDLAGPSYIVSAEEASGIRALRIAARALAAGEIDAAVVGAVDLSHEPVHMRAVRELALDRAPGDAAVVLVLTRLADAHSGGVGADAIAVLDDDDVDQGGFTLGPGGDFDPALIFGHSHAATGLLSVAAATVAIGEGFAPRTGIPAGPALGIGATVDCDVLGAAATSVRLSAPVEHRPRAARGAGHSDVRPNSPRARVFSGANRAEILTMLASGEESNTGPARLVIVVDSDEQFARRSEAAEAWLTGAAMRPPGIAFRERPVHGELAFVYTTGSAAYSGMGAATMRAFPGRLRAVARRVGDVETLAGWAYEQPPRAHPTALEQVWGSTVLAHLHTELSRELLDLRPDAVLAYSSGEMTALTAMGVWRDIGELAARSRRSPLYDGEITGEMRAIRRAWRRQGLPGQRWETFLVPAGPEEVRSAVDDEPAAHLMIVSSPRSCVVGGESGAVRRALSRLVGTTPISVDYDIAIHAPELMDTREQWRELYRQPVSAVPGVRFYSGVSGEPYTLSTEACADAIIAQAVGTIDFAALVENAYRDGVRVFVEHGPRSFCSRQIMDTLGDREHVAVALDTDGTDVRPLYDAVAELIAAGVIDDADTFFSAISMDTHLNGEHATGEHQSPRPAGKRMPIAAHWPPVRMPPPANLVATAAQPLSSTRSGAISEAAVALSEHQRIITATYGTLLAEQGRSYARYQHFHQQSVALLTGAVPSTRTTGPALSRARLEHLSTGGAIASVYGAPFAAVDALARQLRTPAPPMLLIDRVTAISGVELGQGAGRICSETEVTPHSWYLDSAGRMPTGIMLEAAQAHMLLASWLGLDLKVRGERHYRVIGAEYCLFGSPPVPGETVRYDVRIDSHADSGGPLLYFFTADAFVDGQRRLSIRSGTGGFFTAAELTASAGLPWNRPDDSTAALTPVTSVLHEPVLAPGKRRIFNDPPRWRQGYIRAEQSIRPNDWFFHGHLPGDPCMPGTLLVQGGMEILAQYLIATGVVSHRADWRPEPVRERLVRIRTGRQITPATRVVGYEAFITEYSAGTVTADVLCTADGIPAMVLENLSLCYGVVRD